MATEKIEKKRQIKKEQIFKVALEIFGNYGYRKATIEDIAERLNMTKSSLYRYIKDKQELYEQAVSFGLVQWRKAALKAIKGEADPLVQLKKYALAGLTYLDNDTELKNVLLKDPAIFPLNTKEDRFVDINRESMDIVTDILRRGVKKGCFRTMDIEHTATFLYSVYVMFIIKSHVKSDFDSVDDMISAGLETLLFGIVKV